ncbi:uncharacterized protein LOC131163120 [Malania oleifera]|uniref:uncharacterized protein LOC131163120 n=1 Tax=Malania oleifera TaxID=397392 RepID=UPI0025AD9D11|nr:uncharacterized protein LOC131163120 [Malania oleifera]
MGALASPIPSPWIPEDDLLLKNAVEAGASLESLAKGAVQFSRRFMVRELQDRWYSLLYDPVVSGEASARMIEFDHSASNLPSQSHRFRNIISNKCVSGKRKVETVRKCYYAMRKRICSEPLNSMDLSLLLPPSNDNCFGNGDEPFANYMVGDHFSNNFMFEESNMNITGHDFPQTGMDGAADDGIGGTSNAFHTGSHEEDFPGNFSGMEEFCQPNELPVHNLFETDDLEAKPALAFDHINTNPGNICPEFEGSQVCNSPISDSDMPYDNLGYSSPLHEMPLWRTIEGIAAPTMPIDDNLREKDQLTGDTFALPDDDDTKNASISPYDVHSVSKVENQIPCDELKSDASPEGYLAELSNSLMDFSNEEELLLMDNGKYVIGKSFYDGLSSLLSSPHNVNKEHILSVAEPEASVALDAPLMIPSATCCGVSAEDVESHGGDGDVVCNSEAQVLSSASVVVPEFPERRDGVIFCSFNTEDPNIPCNGDIFIPNEVPSTSLSPIILRSFPEAHNPTSSSLKVAQMPSERGPILQKIPGRSNASSQMIGSRMLPEMCQNRQVGDSRDAGITCGDPSQINSENVFSNAFTPGKLKAESVGAHLEQHRSCNAADSFLDKGCDNYRSCPQTYAGCSKVDAQDITQNNQVSHAELDSIDGAVPQILASTITSDQEELPSESDDDIPYVSDIEAMILDMDLGPDDQDLCSIRKALRHQPEEIQRTLIRLEQGGHSYMRRAIASHGAFAVLYGRHSKHYIKKPEVLIGRATEDVSVDIDLRGEGRANKISRRQATITMDKGGSFYLTNLGKCSILVNDKEVPPGQSLSLNSNCLVEIRGMPFIFETNQTCVRQYLDKITKEQAQT